MKPNDKFNLDVNDLALIEEALFLLQTQKPQQDKKDVVNLLAKLHHQKIWYRPKTNYVGG